MFNQNEKNRELNDICKSTCFRVINHQFIYPSKKMNMSYMILYPTDGYYLTKEQYVSIFRVFAQYQNHCYCVSDIEFEDSFTRINYENHLGCMHSIFNDFDYDNYKSQIRLFENALYDLDRKWGISIFQDEIAIIYGENEMIKKIKSNYSSTNDVESLKEFINSNEITNECFKDSLFNLLAHST